MPERLLIVFTRIYARRGVVEGQSPDEYLTVWDRPVASPHWMFPSFAGRHLLVIHATDYESSADAIAQKAIDALAAALAAHPGPAPGHGREVGILLHGDASTLKTVDFSDRIGARPLFVRDYARGDLLFHRLAPAARNGADITDEFDDLWETLIEGVAIALYREAGTLRHRAARINGLIQNVVNWIDTDFTIVDADAIAAEYCDQPFDAAGFCAVFLGPNSFEELVNRATPELPKRHADLIKARQRIRQALPIRDGHVTLPDSLVQLIAAVPDAEAIRAWIGSDRRLARTRAREIVEWWSRLDRAIDDLLKLLAAGDRTPTARPRSGPAYT